MSLRINHNLAALNAHRNLLNTTEDLQSSMQKLSSGYRINQGSDNPAGLVISEQFRAQIAGLNQAIDNSEGSISMIQTAEGALNEINNLLISMRELAIHAANEGFNDADQLAADQAEIENAIATIDRIAQNTQFGTKKLLDGSNANTATITSANSSDLNVVKSNLSSGSHSITATKTADASATLNTTSLGFSLTNTDGDPVGLSEAVHNVDVIQASDVAKKTSNAVTLADAFGNDFTIAAAATVAMLSSSNVATAVAGNVGTYTFTLQLWDVEEGTTALHTITVAAALGDTSVTMANKIKDQLNLNSDLAGKVTASATAAGPIRLKTTNLGAQWALKTTSTTTTATTQWFNFGAADARGVSDNQLTLTATTEANSAVSNTLTLTAGAYTSVQSIVDALNVALTASFGTAAGSTDSDLVASIVNGNRIQVATRDEGSAYSLLFGTMGAATGNLEHYLGLSQDSSAITGQDAQVSFDGYTNTIDKVKYGSTTDVVVGDKAAGETGRGTVSLTLANAVTGVNLGSTLLDVTASKFDVRLDGGPATSISAGVNSTIYNADRSESIVVNYDLASIGGTESINNVDRSLVFQIGANVGQTTAIGLRSMSTTMLSKNLVGNMFSSLATIDVTTVQGAQDSQSIIDAAINEVSTTRGTLGSFQKNTLESNLRNLRIAAQNLTASESQIRDTDMAAEMSEFTKNQILLQAGTAMLAQANQVPQIILSLFG
ncbi:MAG: flagellin [bacterium]